MSQKQPYDVMPEVESGDLFTDTYRESVEYHVEQNADPSVEDQMRMTERSGSLDFWMRPEEDVYSMDDGEPV
jgi:hypothetical protein